MPSQPSNQSRDAVRLATSAPRTQAEGVGFPTRRLRNGSHGTVGLRSGKRGAVVPGERKSRRWRPARQRVQDELETLTRILDAFGGESSADALLGHVLGTMARRLEARVVSLWVLEAQYPLPTSHLVYDEGRIASTGDARCVAGPDALEAREQPIAREILRTRKPVVCCDLDCALPEAANRPLPRAATGTVLTVPLFVAGRVIGMIGLRGGHRPRYRRGEVELAQAFARQATLVIQLARLAERGRAAAVIEERNRLARDIHDTLAQGFTGVSLQLEAAEEALTRRATSKARHHIIRARSLARQSLGEARRSVLALRPEALERGDFASTLRRLLAQMTQGTRLRGSLRVVGEPRPVPPLLEEHFLHIAREALTNTLKHARATRFRIDLSYRSRVVRMLLQDDGCGIDLLHRHKGLGLLGMQERAQQIGGQLRISRQSKGGTSILVVAPGGSAQRSLAS